MSLCLQLQPPYFTFILESKSSIVPDKMKFPQASLRYCTDETKMETPPLSPEQRH